VLIGSLIFGLVAGLLAGGRLDNLAGVRLRLVQVLFLGLILRYATELAIDSGNQPVDALRLPLFAAGFGLLLIGLWVNREQPGLPLAFVGILLNGVAIVSNAGYMPVWEPSVLAAGLPSSEIGTAFHRIVGTAGTTIPANFLVQAGPLGDIIPIPIPYLRNVASIGDLFLAAGLAFFLFATTLRTPIEIDEASLAAIRRRVQQLGLPGAAALEPAAGEAAAYASEAVFVSPLAVERPLAAAGALAGEGTIDAGVGIPVPGVPSILERARGHPYIRLALDSSFSALWTGQLISLIGDRVHQIALAFLVLGATDSAIAVGAVFLVATLPNLLFGPLAGTLVDRWDHREVMIVSDLLRAGIVMLIPVAAVTNLALVYPLVFLVTSISVFFRPAKGAILPRMVSGDDLVAANSALWVGETFADIGGYALAGLFVALLGSQLPLAFWVDAVTYLASALLIASIAVAPLARVTGGSGGLDAAAEAARGATSAVERLLQRTRVGSAALMAEMRAGWQFLRGDTVLLANTLQATVGQFMLGVFLTLTPVYARDAINGLGFESATVYSFIEGSIGAGNLVGGFLIGLVGTRFALGRMVILGYAATGAMVAAMALTGNLYIAIGLAFGTGVGNLAFVIPSQTLFQTRTPQELMGRVLGIRFSIVFGSMTIAMGIGGILGEAFGAATVIGAFGVVTLLAGLAGILVPAVRDA
jgi:MFS family permease